MANENFSNSDVSRFMLAAQTNSGELAVKGNIFYKASTLKDFTNDVYISSITKPKNTNMAISKAIELLDVFNKPNTEIPSDYYQLEPPNIVRIEYNGFYYYNVKTLLYKDNTLIIDHPSVKDVYIKLHPTNNQNITPEMYKQNILGISPLDASNITVPIDIIISFDFFIKETNTGNSQKMLLPLSNELIDKVFKPIYNTANSIYVKVQDLNKQPNLEQAPRQPEGENGVPVIPAATQGLGTTWFKQEFSDKEPPANDTFFNIPAAAGEAQPFFSEYIGQIQEQFIPTISNSTLKDFSLKYTDFDFYKYLLLYAIIKDYSRPKIQKPKEKDEARQDVNEEEKQDEAQQYVNEEDLSLDGGAINTTDVLNLDNDEVIENFNNIYLSSLNKYNENVFLTEILKGDKINFEPFILKKLSDGVNDMNLLYNKDTNSCLIKVGDYIELIQNYKMYNGKFKAIAKEGDIKDNYISISVDIFKILLRLLKKIMNRVYNIMLYLFLQKKSF
jgi:hypothetical protein